MSVNIRLMGTHEEVLNAVRKISTKFEIIDYNEKTYPNRGNKNQVRKYLNVDVNSSNVLTEEQSKSVY